MANCPDCGGFLKFDIPSQKIHCSYCNNFYDPEFIDQVNNAEETVDFTVFTCPNCGGELFSTDHDLSGNCSYCGSPVVFESRMRAEKRPDFIIPFAVTKDDCKAAYLEKIKSSNFVPKALKDADYIDGFRGIYVPYWFYEVEQNGKPFDIKASHTYTEGDYDYTEEYDLHGVVQSYYQSIYHDASSVMGDDISEQIEPYELCDEKGNESKVKPFYPSYFSGFYAEPVDVDPHTYDQYAVDVAETKTKEYLDKESEFSQFNISSKLNSDHYNTQITGARLAALPVWFLSYKKGDRVAYAAVNGQTGRLISDVPISFGKFFRTLLITALLLFGILSFMTITPMTVTMISIFVAGLITSFCRDEVGLLVQRSLDLAAGKKRNKNKDSHGTFIVFLIVMVIALIAKIVMYFDNEVTILVSRWLYLPLAGAMLIWQIIMVCGMLSKLKLLVKAKYAGMIFVILSMAATCYGIIVLATKPVNDMAYYSSAFITVGICLVSFVGMLINYNKVATRPLPQFNLHRGGDDRA